ncbi:MAG: hypothetical protein CENE_02545 [Candidatus Celerinatantimonas neptuna]|nr:MAG: hypothetical protein CENE_02545 [Candidatus Celerinatantimonas neptuna]
MSESRLLVKSVDFSSQEHIDGAQTQLALSLSKQVDDGFFADLCQQLIELFSAQTAFIFQVDEGSSKYPKLQYLAQPYSMTASPDCLLTLEETPFCKFQAHQRVLIDDHVMAEFPHFASLFGHSFQSMWSMAFRCESHRSVSYLTCLFSSHPSYIGSLETVIEPYCGRIQAEFQRNVDDLRERKFAEQRIYDLAYYDELTGLVNRRKLLAEIKSAFRHASRQKCIGALLFIDLDHFKNINDSLGHSVGDWILEQVAKRLGQIVRQGDLLGRLGGDEFVLLLTDLGANPYQAELQANTLAERLIKSVSEPYQFKHQMLHLGASVGVSLFPGKGQSADDLLRQADTAMYKAKSAGRRTVMFFEQGMQREAERRLSIHNQLREALGRQELQVHYQPQHMVSTGELIGTEALVRWHPPGRMPVLPGEFIPVAEETDLIIDIGRWVFKESCETFVRWQKQGYPMAELSVNVSARQFHDPNFIGYIESVLVSTGIDPARLNLEVTESVVLGDVEETIRKMNVLKQKGISFSIDDFGSGYSSLSYLKRLPIDELKIDRSFICDIPHDRRNMAIVEAILALAEHLGFNVTAEGVETRQQLDFLRLRGCRFYQGFLSSKALSEKAMLNYLVRHSGKTMG